MEKPSSKTAHRPILSRAFPRLALCSLCSLWLIGCAPYQSKIKWGNASLALPKDAHFDLLRFEQSGPTNFSITISNATFKMNPAVIDAKTRHDVELFKAGASTVESLIEKIP